MKAVGEVYADGYGSYVNRIAEGKLTVGKENTQKIERNHLTSRTRIKKLCRKTICFSEKPEIHETVV